MNKIQNYRAVVWDMDGTLLDTLPDIEGALNETLAAWGLEQVTTEQTLSYVGHGAEYLCRCVRWYMFQSLYDLCSILIRLLNSRFLEIVAKSPF